MNKENFEREVLYQATLAIAWAMNRRGIVTEDEIDEFDTKMHKKHRPLLGTLYSGKFQKRLDISSV